MFLWISCSPVYYQKQLRKPNTNVPYLQLQVMYVFSVLAIIVKVESQSTFFSIRKHASWTLFLAHSSAAKNTWLTASYPFRLLWLIGKWRSIVEVAIFLVGTNIRLFHASSRVFFFLFTYHSSASNTQTFSDVWSISFQASFQNPRSFNPLHFSNQIQNASCNCTLCCHCIQHLLLRTNEHCSSHAYSVRYVGSTSKTIIPFHTNMDRSLSNGSPMNMQSVTVGLDHHATHPAREYVTTAPQMSYTLAPAQIFWSEQSYLSASSANARSSLQAASISTAAASQSRAIQDDRKKFCAKNKCHKNAADNLQTHLAASVVVLFALIMVLALM